MWQGKFNICLDVASSVLACLALLGPGACTHADSTQDGGLVAPPPISAARLKALEEALGKGKGLFVLRRALQESEPYIGENPSLVRAILAGGCLDEKGSEVALVVVALSNSRGQAVQDIIGAYREAPPKRRSILRLVFCRMSMEAAAAVPMLRAELTSPQLPAGEAMAIKVALAGIGQATDSELEEIAQAILLGGETGSEAVSTMVGCGRNLWVTGKIKAAMVKVAERAPSRDVGDDFRLLAIMALGTLGEASGTNVQTVLASAFETALKTPESCEFIIDGLSLVKADAQHRRGTLHTLLGIEGAVTSGRSIEFVQGLFAGIRDKGFISDVASFLSDQNPEVCCGAAVILSALGPAAQAATPQLLRLLESSRDEAVREAAASALGMVADLSDLKELQRLTEATSSDKDLKKVLNESIKVIQLRD